MYKKTDPNKEKCFHNIQFSKYFEDMLTELIEKMGISRAAVVRTAVHEFYINFKNKEKLLQQAE